MAFKASHLPTPQLPAPQFIVITLSEHLPYTRLYARALEITRLDTNSHLKELHVNI